jgi:uncharacterized membrane protein
VHTGSAYRPVKFVYGGVSMLPPYNTNAVAAAISQNGVTAGSWFFTGGSWGFEAGIGGPGSGGFLNLQPVSGSTAGAWAINANATLIFGRSTVAGGYYHPTKWTLSYTALGHPYWAPSDLGMPGGQGWGYVNDSNQWGSIVAASGWSTTGVPLAFYWQSGLGIRSLTDYGTCGYRAALGANDVGQIVGVGCTAGGRQHAMLWT